MLLEEDVLDKGTILAETKGLRCQQRGGGRIKHDSTSKTIFIYGYSVVRSVKTRKERSGEREGRGRGRREREAIGSEE